MKLAILLIGVVLSGWTHAAPTVVSSVAVPPNAAAVSITMEEHDRFDSELHLDVQFLPTGGQSMVGQRLVANSTTVTVTYLGTLARHSGFLGIPGAALFDIRSGCTYAESRGDANCIINSVSTGLVLSAQLNEEVVFQLNASAFDGTPYSKPSTSAAAFSSTSSDDDVRVYDLGQGSLLIGFETFADPGTGQDWLDAVIKVTGLSLAPLATVGPLQTVPEPGTAPLIALAMPLIAAMARRKRLGARGLK